VGGAKGKGPKACYDAVMADAECQKDYFTYAARGDENCECKTSDGALSVRAGDTNDYYAIRECEDNVKCYAHAGLGVAGLAEKWNVGGAKGKGPKACYDAVMADAECQKDYFTYAARGDKNCECKTSDGALSVRAGDSNDYYVIREC